MAHEVTDECRDYPTSDLPETVLDGAENRMWYLHEIVQGNGNTV